MRFLKILKRVIALNKALDRAEEYMERNPKSEKDITIEIYEKIKILKKELYSLCNTNNDNVNYARRKMIKNNI